MVNQLNGLRTRVERMVARIGLSTTWTPVVILCLALVLFLVIAGVVVLSLIPLYLSEKDDNTPIRNSSDSSRIINLAFAINLATSISITENGYNSMAQQISQRLGYSQDVLGVRLATLARNVIASNNRKKKRQTSGTLSCDAMSNPTNPGAQNNNAMTIQVYVKKCPKSKCLSNYCLSKCTPEIKSDIQSKLRSISFLFTIETNTGVLTIEARLCLVGEAISVLGSTSATQRPTTDTMTTLSGLSTTPAWLGVGGKSASLITNQKVVSRRRRRSLAEQGKTPHMPVGGALIISFNNSGANSIAELRNTSSFVKYLPMGVQQIKAIDGQQIDLHAFLREGKISKKHYNALVSQDHLVNGHFLTEGALGCLETHVRAWQYTVENDMPMLIFEDDIHLHTDLFDVILPYLLFGLPTNFSLLYFGNLIGESLQASLIDYNDLLWKMSTPNWGTYAYLISPEAAVTLLNSIYPVQAQVDSMIMGIAQFESLNVFMSKQVLVKTDNRKNRASRVQRYKVLPIVIPRIFHFIWLNTKPLPSAAEINIQRWAQLHPNWQIRVWTDESNITFYLSNQNIFTRSLKAPRQASDILRYEIIHQYGGIYLDVDFEPLQNIEPLLHGIEAFVVHEDESMICNGVFGAVAEHELTERLVTQLDASWTKYENSTVNQRTGPYYMTRQIQAMEPEKKTMKSTFQIFAPHLFFPYAWYEQDPGHPYDPSAFAVHHFRSVTEINHDAKAGQ